MMMRYEVFYFHADDVENLKAKSEKVVKETIFS